jgi:hypothetical protein
MDTATVWQTTTCDEDVQEHSDGGGPKGCTLGWRCRCGRTRIPDASSMMALVPLTWLPHERCYCGGVSGRLLGAAIEPHSKLEFRDPVTYAARFASQSGQSHASEINGYLDRSQQFLAQQKRDNARS